MNSSQSPEYCFVVEDVNGDSYELDIAPSDDRAKQHFQSVWQRLSASMVGMQKIESIVLPNWVEWKPWDWCTDTRAAYQARQKFVAWCGNTQVGLLNVWPGFDSVCDPGQKTMYIEHLGVAPGSMNTLLWNRKYRRVGTTLLAYAVKLSRDQGYEGRLALHASNAEALGFYRNLHSKTLGGLFHPERVGVIGPTPHGLRSDSNLRYLETNVAGASRLLEDYRNG